MITIQLNVVRNGFTSLLRTETLDVRMPELQKVSKIITENPTGWGAEVRDEVQDVQGVMSLDEAVLEGLLLMSSENGETLLKQLKHYPVGKEVLARGKNHAAGVNELTKKKTDGADGPRTDRSMSAARLTSASDRFTSRSCGPKGDGRGDCDFVRER
mgnify:CR=1 FL=1